MLALKTKSCICSFPQTVYELLQQVSFQCYFSHDSMNVHVQTSGAQSTDSEHALESVQLIDHFTMNRATSALKKHAIKSCYNSCIGNVSIC